MEFKDVEEARKAYYEKSKKYFMTEGLILLAALIVIIIIAKVTGIFEGMLEIFMIIIFCIPICLVITAFATRKEANAYTKLYKGFFIEKTLGETFTNMVFHHELGIGKDELKATGMVDTGARYSSNDYTKAKYKDIGFTQADVHIEEEYTDSDGDKHYVTTFKGRIMFFEFPKKFDFRLGVIGKKVRSAIKMYNGDKRKVEKRETESVEFNRHFKIFAEDGFEMYYLLNPALMERMQAIADMHENRVAFGFIDNKLMIALDNGNDSFEAPSVRKKIDEKTETEKVRSEIKIITDFVDQLKIEKKK